MVLIFFKYLLLIVIAVILQVQISMPVDFLAITCVYIALRRGRRVAGIVCVVGGLLENMISDSPIGLRSLSLMIGCWVICSITHLIYKEHVTTKFGCAFLGTSIALGVEWMGLRFMDQIYWTAFSLGQVLVPVAFWTACFALILIPLCDRMIGTGHEQYFAY